MGLARCQDEDDRSARTVGDHASLGAKATTRAAKRFTPCRVAPACRLFGRAGCLLMGTDVAAVEACHPEWHVPLLDQPQQAFPDPEPSPADEGLRGHPPRSQLVRYGTPLGTIVVPPKDRADRASQMPQRHLGGRTAHLDQGFKQALLRLCQHATSFQKEGQRIKPQPVQTLTEPRAVIHKYMVIELMPSRRPAGCDRLCVHSAPQQEQNL
jgi:hypothetical protein